MYIAIGKIVTTYGVDGYVKVLAYSGLPERFKGLKTIQLESARGLQGFIIEDLLIRPQGSMLKLRNIDNKESAKQLVGCEILVPESEKIELPENQYFIHDLIGLDVFDTNQNAIGTLEEIMSNAGNDIYVIRKGEEEVLVPAISEFIKSIDLTNRRITVKLLEGM